MEDFEECPHAPLLLRARQLPYQHFPSCNPCCIPVNSSTCVSILPFNAALSVPAVSLQLPLFSRTYPYAYFCFLAWCSIGLGRLLTRRLAARTFKVWQA